MESLSPLTVALIALLITPAAFTVILQSRYAGKTVLLHTYLKTKYPKEFENIINRDGQILSVISEGGGGFVTHIGLSKSRIRYQFKALTEIAAFGPNDSELQKQISALRSTLTTALYIIYGSLGTGLLALIVMYVLI